MLPGRRLRILAHHGDGNTQGLQHDFLIRSDEACFGKETTATERGTAAGGTVIYGAASCVAPAGTSLALSSSPPTAEPPLSVKIGSTQAAAPRRFCVSSAKLRADAKFRSECKGCHGLLFLSRLHQPMPTIRPFAPGTSPLLPNTAQIALYGQPRTKRIVMFRKHYSNETKTRPVPKQRTRGVAALQRLAEIECLALWSNSISVGHCASKSPG
jgi:hypothetical protein